MSYFRSAIDNMTGYVPGEQPSSERRVIKLNTNENPYPPSPKVLQALQTIELESLRRYPDSRAKEFCQAVSDIFGMPADWVIVGNSSDDLLNILVRSCAEGCDLKVAYPTPTYVLYRTLAAMQPADVVEIPYPDDFRLPIAELVATNAAIIFVASPNSPSGHAVTLQELQALAEAAPGLVVVDEAYVDFAEVSALFLVEKFDNVIVLRTLSKGYSLAGLRLGFGIANPDLLAGLFKVKDSYNVDSISITLGCAALRDQAYKNSCVEKVKASRHQLTVDLKNLGFTVIESHGNFVLTTPPVENTEQLYQALKQRGILVRYFNQPGLDDKLRISIGTEEQNQILLETLASLIGHG
ncbi:MAG: histidinol-phosphate transaminase [Cyanobacteria bacterium P01_D01_bin.156]